MILSQNDIKSLLTALPETERRRLLDEVRRAADTVKKGGVVLYPTDTVWGLGCDSSCPEAVERIFRLKERSDAKSMIVLVDSVAALERTVDDIPEVAWQLIEAADKPLTIIYDHPKGVVPSLIAEDGSLGVRLTGELFSALLCSRLKAPLVSTSANKSGQPTPRNFSEIPREIIEGADYVADYRRDDTTRPQPSGIIKISDSGLFKIIR